MILFRYIVRQLLLNIFTINLGLTLLFNLIEFFEKMVRISNTNTSTILYFIALNLIPSFFDNLAVSSWLGSCLTIKDMSQQNEWETLSLLNIKLKQIFFFVLISGAILSSISLVGKDILSQKIAQKAELFKLKQFKQNQHEKLFNQWFSLDNNIFCHFHYLDMKNEIGSKLSILEVSPQFNLKKITYAPSFSINSTKKEIVVEEGTTIFTDTKQQIKLNNTNFTLPGFFTQLTVRGATHPINQLISVLLFDKNVLPYHIYHQLLFIFLSRLLSHLLLIFLPLLTFLLFFAFPHHKYYRWGAIFLPYPAFSTLSAINNASFSNVSNGLAATTPYVILLAITIGLFFYIRK